jgi:hypothetical protein
VRDLAGSAVGSTMMKLAVFTGFSRGFLLPGAPIRLTRILGACRRFTPVWAWGRAKWRERGDAGFRGWWLRVGSGLGMRRLPCSPGRAL